MSKIMVPVDGSDYSVRAMQEAIRIAGAEPSEIFALNVQPPIVSGHARMFLSKEVIQDYYDSEGNLALKTVEPVLAQSGLTFRLDKRIGPVAETIAEYAGEHGCDLIVMGTRGLGSVKGMLLGSVATKVVHLASMPVTLVK